MKKTTIHNGKLKLGKETITKLSNLDMAQVAGGMQKYLPPTASVCARQCCNTDRMANCSSQPDAGC